MVLEPRRVLKVQDPEHSERQVAAGRAETEARRYRVSSCRDWREGFGQGTWGMTKAGSLGPGESE